MGVDALCEEEPAEPRAVAEHEAGPVRGADQRADKVAEEDDAGDGARGLRAGRHRDRHVGGEQRVYVVRAASHHRDEGPAALSACTMRAFCGGSTRPNTVCASTAFSSAASSIASTASPSTGSPASTPSCASSAATVAGWSPPITFGAIASSSISANAASASGRSSSPSVASASGRAPAERLAVRGEALHLADHEPARAARASA